MSEGGWHWAGAVLTLEREEEWDVGAIHDSFFGSCEPYGADDKGGHDVDDAEFRLLAFDELLSAFVGEFFWRQCMLGRGTDREAEGLGPWCLG